MPIDKKDLRIVFMGTPDFAVKSLSLLVESGYSVVAVVTQPDKSVGRHASVLRPSAVKEYAMSVGLPVLQPVKMKDEAFVSRLKSFEADLQVVVAFRMLPEVVWAMPRFGTFNVHASLLPQYRGAAPINWAIINGEATTGVTTFFLDNAIDTGRIIMQREFAIPQDADAGYVYEGLSALGAKVCIETVDEIMAKGVDVSTRAQSSVKELKPAPKIFRDTCLIDWNRQCKMVYDFIRGLSPQPGAWTEIAAEGGVSSVVKIFRSTLTSKACCCNNGEISIEDGHLYVATADEWLEITELQIAGKKRMQAKDFVNGLKRSVSWRMLNKV